MAVEVLYNTTATSVFLGLQSGLARPYWEINITVSGDDHTFSGTIGAAYTPHKILEMSDIDREKPVRVSELSKIFKSDLTVTLNNSLGTYSPLATAGIFTNTSGTSRDYLNSVVNVWGGFENTSGTAYTIQRGSFLLRKIRIDSEKQIAYLQCEDVLKVPLNRYVGLDGISGTATPFTPPSGTSTKAIMADMLSGVGLTASQWDLASGIDYSGYSVTNERVSDALGKLAQRSDGYVYGNGKGQLVFAKNVATGGAGSVTTLTATDHDKIKELRYTVDVNNLIKKCVVSYQSGLSVSRGAEDVTVLKGAETTISNDAINQPAQAAAVAGRIVGEFGINRYFAEIDAVWLPSIELGDSIEVWDSNTHQTAIVYQVYRLRDSMMNVETKIYAVSDVLSEKKFSVCSSSGLPSSTIAGTGTVFTNHWHSGYGFCAYNESTAVNPAFDLEGNNNNIINTGLAVSGVGTTGIELPFVCR